MLSAQAYRGQNRAGWWGQSWEIASLSHQAASENRRLSQLEWKELIQSSDPDKKLAQKKKIKMISYSSSSCLKQRPNVKMEIKKKESLSKSAKSFVFLQRHGKISLLLNKTKLFFFPVTGHSECEVWVGYVISTSFYSTLHSVGNHLTFSYFFWFTA